VSQAREPIDPPWPWEKELPFPWDNIEGTWGGVYDGETMVFSFKIIDSGTGHRQIRVKQINPENMTVTARGLGVEYNNVLRATVVGDGHEYRMSVRLIENTYCLDNRQYTLITIESIGREKFVFHFTIQKILNSALTQPTYFNYKTINFSNNTLINKMCLSKE
jgi:hypothetical protein